MRRADPTKPPYLSFCLSVRDSEVRGPGLLERCLQSVRRRAPDAEIVIVDNLSSDEATVEISKRYADVWAEFDGPNHGWKRSDPWTPDMAASREFGFSLAHGTWRSWIDDDDELADPDEAERLLKLNGKWKPPPGPGREVIEVASSDGAKDEAGAALPPTLEDLLRWLEQNRPQVEWLSAFYAYEFEVSPEDGRVKIWQERERIFKWAPGRWKWAEAAHESMVYADGRQWKPQMPVPALLWVHHKKHTPQDRLYSLQRHFAVLIDEYTRGRRTTRNCLYLDNYARFLCPDRMREFLSAARDCAADDLDRSRAEVGWGNYYAERGMKQEAKAAFGAAVQFRPDLCDPWAAGANAAVAFEDWDWAMQWWRRACEAEVGPGSLVNPREHLLRFPILLSQALSAAAKRLIDPLHHRVEMGHHLLAQDLLKQSWDWARRASENPAIGEDLMEARTFTAARKNDYEAQAAALVIHGLWDHLVRNDETKKAADLRQIIPHTLEDHPLVLAIEEWSKKIDTHLSDDGAYRDFYTSELTSTDVLPSDGKWLTPENCLPRAHFLAEWILQKKPDATVLEVGSFDGVTGIPVLRACPSVRYTACDASGLGLKRFLDRAVEYGVSDRLETEIGTDLDLDDSRKFDVVVFFEVIEHVPDPAASIERLLDCLKPGGRLFLSTPWGAYDRGSPPELQSNHPRDPRGHVRAITAWALARMVEAAGGAVEYLSIGRCWAGDFGHTLHAIVRPEEKWPKVLSFYVRGALWEWNGTHVEQTGIGASEESIVYLADQLAKKRHYDPKVFGPVPEPEVLRGVEYAERLKIRHVESGTVVVSRAPSVHAELDRLMGWKARKILWLQDAWYPDFDAAAIDAYEKVVVLTEWHKAAMHEQHGVPLDKLVVIPNFLLRKHFEVAVPPVRDPHHFVYASSPDRGLVNLLRLWPEIRAMWPDATLDIFYGFEGAKKLAGGAGAPGWVTDYRRLRNDYEGLRYQPGIFERGRVNHETIAQEFLRASAWPYPTTFAETQCLNAVKARAAGCIPVTTPYAGLTESARCDWTRYVPLSEGSNPIDDEWKVRFLAALKDAVENTTDGDRSLMASQALDEYEIEAILPRWLDVLKE